MANGDAASIEVSAYDGIIIREEGHLQIKSLLAQFYNAKRRNIHFVRYDYYKSNQR